MAEKERNVRCDSCGCGFEPVVEEKWEGEIQSVFFRCPFCRKPYLISVTDEALRNSVQMYKSIFVRSRKKRMPEHILEEMEKRKQENLRRCEELKVLYPMEAVNE